MSPRIRHAALAAPAGTAWFSAAVSPWGSATRQNLNHRAIHRRLHPPGDRDRAQQIAPGNTAGRWHLRNTFADSPAPHAQTPHGEHSVAEPTRRDTQSRTKRGHPRRLLSQAPTHPAGHTPECPGPRTVVVQYRRQAVLEQPIDTVCHLNIEIQEARLRTPHTHLTTDEKSACTVTHGPIY